jgi:hypothetical protein
VFEIAEKHVGVPRLLEASDLLSEDPDERAIQLYVSLFFDAFSLRKVNTAFAPPDEGLLRTSSPHLLFTISTVIFTGQETAEFDSIIEITPAAPTADEPSEPVSIPADCAHSILLSLGSCLATH